MLNWHFRSQFKLGNRCNSREAVIQNLYKYIQMGRISLWLSGLQLLSEIKLTLNSQHSERRLRIVFRNNIKNFQHWSKVKIT